VGAGVGKAVGAAVGAEVGCLVGRVDGAAVGCGVGEGVGKGVGAALTHTLPSQLLLLQSLCVRHARPSLHFGHSGPPQSISVSLPLTALSMHEGAVGALVGARVGEIVGAGDGVDVGI